MPKLRVCAVRDALIGSFTLLFAMGAGCGPGERTHPESSAPPLSAVLGIDVSHYQGTIDWESLARSNTGPERLSFAMAKADEGSSMADPRFAANFAGMRSAGLLRAAYDFYDVGVNPTTQAESFIRMVTLEAGDLPPVVDIETPVIGPASKAQLIADLHTYLTVMEAHYGVRPIIYTDGGFWNANMDDSFGDYPLWLSEFGPVAHVPAGWTAWTFWQYSDTGRVTGIAGNVDLDRFNGSLEAVQAMALRSTRAP